MGARSKQEEHHKISILFCLQDRTSTSKQIPHNVKLSDAESIFFTSFNKKGRHLVGSYSGRG